MISAMNWVVLLCKTSEEKTNFVRFTSWLEFCKSYCHKKMKVDDF